MVLPFCVSPMFTVYIVDVSHVFESPYHLEGGSLPRARVDDIFRFLVSDGPCVNQFVFSVSE